MRFSFRKKERNSDAASSQSTQLKPSLAEPAMKSVKEKAADTFGGVSYSLVTGAMLDYAVGLNLTGIIASRTSATTMNLFTSAPYGMWRNFIFRTAKTTESSRNTRKMLTDLLAFNTFQVPIYATGIAIGSFASEGRIDWEKVAKGAIFLASLSPLIGPAFGWYMDRIRKAFGAKSAAEQVGSKLM